MPLEPSTLNLIKNGMGPLGPRNFFFFYFFKINSSLSTMGMDTRHAMVMFLVKYDVLMMIKFKNMILLARAFEA